MAFRHVKNKLNPANCTALPHPSLFPPPEVATNNLLLNGRFLKSLNTLGTVSGVHLRGERLDHVLVISKTCINQHKKRAACTIVGMNTAESNQSSTCKYILIPNTCPRGEIHQNCIALCVQLLRSGRSRPGAM